MSDLERPSLIISNLVTWRVPLAKVIDDPLLSLGAKGLFIVMAADDLRTVDASDGEEAYAQELIDAGYAGAVNAND